MWRSTTRGRSTVCFKRPAKFNTNEKRNRFNTNGNGAVGWVMRFWRSASTWLVDFTVNGCQKQLAGPLIVDLKKIILLSNSCWVAGALMTFQKSQFFWSLLVTIQCRWTCWCFFYELIGLGTFQFDLHHTNLIDYLMIIAGVSKVVSNSFHCKQ